MAKPPKRDPKADWYWPLGALSYASEIHDFFPDEAELLGVITILWNRQELALKELYRRLIASKRPAFAEAIWDRQPTHKARRDLIGLALHTVKLTKYQASALTWVLDNTKTIADRRNELIHAEYVVHARTDELHAKVSPPNSSKPPKHQKVDVKALQRMEAELAQLVQTTELARFAFDTRKNKHFSEQLRQIAEVTRQLRENRHIDSPPPSPRQTPDEAPHGPPQSSEG